MRLIRHDNDRVVLGRNAALRVMLQKDPLEIDRTVLTCRSCNRPHPAEKPCACGADPVLTFLSNRLQFRLLA